MTTRGNKLSFTFLMCLLTLFPSLSQTQEVPPPPPSEGREVKSLPVCLDFTDVYSRSILGMAKATQAEESEMAALASIMMGYISALQDIYGARLVGMGIADNEWTLLESVYQYCQLYPHLTFQRAVRALPPVSQTIQALQNQEFKRCQAYIEQTKTTICMQENK